MHILEFVIAYRFLVSKRNFEVFLESGGTSVKSLMKQFEKNGDRDSIMKMMRDRNARLDDLCYALASKFEGIR